MRQYVIGVDGGNTKTDYMLFTVAGEFVDCIRDATCSHEVLGYRTAETILQARLHQLMVRNKISPPQVSAAVFGLAGIDTAAQHDHFMDFFAKLGLPLFTVENDSLLGVLAGTSKGFGICSINGTGTVTGGIDPLGNRLQVGGMGLITGDDASGAYIAQWGARAVYESFYRCGGQTLMTAPVYKLLGINEPDKLLQAIDDYNDLLSSADMTKIVFDAANNEDPAALQVLDYAAQELAKTSAGCVRNLHFDEEIEVVLAGFVWVKLENHILLENYQRYMAAYLPSRTLKYHILQKMPVTGAVLWAMKLAGQNCFEPEIRQKVFNEVEKALRSL